MNDPVDLFSTGRALVEGEAVQLVGLISLLCIAGGVAGITAGLFGNGGGFVVVPALLLVFPFFSPGNESLVYLAIGTSLATIVVSSARSVQAHARTGAVDFSVLRDWAIWLVAGVLIGLWLATVVDATSLLLIFAGGVGLYAIYFLFPNALRSFAAERELPQGAARASLACALGGFSALLGIGGGTITVLTMVLCNRSIHQAVATAAGVGCIIGATGATGFLILGLEEADLPWGSIGYINVPALLAICSVSVVTAPFGARLAQRLDELVLKRTFGVYLLCVSLSMYLKAVSV